jgi:glycosyltransferase involved in cell wall biosynthesis
MTRRGHQVRVMAVSDAPDNLTFATYTYAARPPRRYLDGDVEVTLLGARPWQRAAMLPVAVRRVPYLRSRAFGRLAQLTLPAFAAAHQSTLNRAARAADLVHGFGAQYLGACGLRAARRAGIPFAITPYCHPGHWGDDPMNVATYRGADLVLALDGSDAATYVRLGVDQRRVRIMPQPIVPGPLLDKQPQRDVPYALFLGRVSSYKGVRALYDAWPLVREQVDAELLVAGPIQEAIAAPAGVRYLGVVEGEAKAELLAGARLLALPSRGELLGAVVLEAWTHGTPVVVSDIPMLQSLVRHGVDGLVANPAPPSLAAALIRLLRNPGLARTLGENGRRRVGTDHAPASVAERLLGYYARTSEGSSVRCSA